MSYKVSVFDSDYVYKAKNNKCYFCENKVNDYVPKYCNCNNKSTCELCTGSRPGNFPLCKKCEKEYIKSQFKEGKDKDKKVK